MQKRRILGICCGVTCGIISIGLIVFAFFTSKVLNSVLLSQAGQNVLLKNSTYNQWGNIPGSTNTFVYKNYSFFNFMNAENFTYFNQTPKFVETPSFDYQEFQHYLDVNYSSNNSQGEPTLVSYYYQQYNLRVNTTDDSQTRNVVNIAPFGLWYTIKTITDDFIGINAFAQLQAGLVVTLYPSVLAQGILSLNMKDFDTCNQSIFKNIVPPLTTVQMEALWNDTVYGMGSTSSFPIWIVAARESNVTGAAAFLADYFHITQSQVMQILSNPLQGWMTSLDGILATWWNCSTVPCDPMYLGALQWSNQNITNNPPPSGGTVPFPSIVTVNNSVVGFPEISYYLNGYLLANNFTGNISNYQNLTFSTELGLQVLNGTPTPPYQYCATNQTLLNLINYNFVLSVGAQFEQNGGSPDNLKGLEQIQERWNLPSLEHAYVFYKYCDYFVHEFALLHSLNGTKGYVGIGTLGTQAMYQNFVRLQSTLHSDFLTRAIQVNVTNDNIGCQELMNNSLNGTTQDVLDKICSLPQLTNFDFNSLSFLTAVCYYTQQYAYQVFVNSTGLKSYDMDAICQYQGPRSFGLYFTTNQQLFGSWYNCSNLSSYCSDYDFAVLQWGSSAITSNLPPILQNAFPVKSSLTVADFYPSLFPKAFEYLPVMKFLSPNFPDEPLVGLNASRSVQLLNFLSFYSATVIQRGFLYNLTGNLANFTQLFGFTNPAPVLWYFRYLVLEFAMQGPVQTRSGHELLYGYTDPLLAQAQATSVLAGGDPSTNPIISLGGQNSSEQDARTYWQQMVKTGADNTSNVKTLVQIQNLTFINYNCSYFNGLEVVHDFVTPWAENVPVSGTDATLNPQGLKANDSISVYVPDMFLAGSSSFSNETLDYQGLTTWKYKIGNKTIANKTNNPDNAKFYFDRWNGAVNISKVQRAPIFFTKQYFLDADWELVEAVEMYNDTAMTQRIWPSNDYDLAIYIEPNSGVSLKADQRLQLNIYFEPDELFPNIKPAMLPILYVYRGFAFSEQTINDLFESLKIGLFLKNYGIWIFLGVGIFMILMSLLCLFCCCRKKGEKKRDEAEEDLMASADA